MDRHPFLAKPKSRAALLVATAAILLSATYAVAQTPDGTGDTTVPFTSPSQQYSNPGQGGPAATTTPETGTAPNTATTTPESGGTNNATGTPDSLVNPDPAIGGATATPDTILPRVSGPNSMFAMLMQLYCMYPELTALRQNITVTYFDQGNTSGTGSLMTLDEMCPALLENFSLPGTNDGTTTPNIAPEDASEPRLLRRGQIEFWF